VSSRPEFARVFSWPCFALLSWHEVSPRGFGVLTPRVCLCPGIHDKEEAKICIQELYEKGFAKPRVNVEVVRAGLMQAMDGGDKEGELIGSLLGYLVKEEIISDDAVAKGFVAVLADLPDITIDIPMAPKIVAGVLTTLLELDFVAKSLLAPGLQTLFDSGCSSWKHFEEIQKALV
jgi:hypothetical protein